MIHERHATGTRWLALAGALVFSAGCNLIAGLDDFHVIDGSGGAKTTSGLGGHAGSTTSTSSSGCDACPEPEGTCRVAACVNDACGQVDAPDGTSAKVQITGDCKKLTCMGGVPTPEDDDTDPPEIPGDCKVHICTAGNVVVTFEPMSSTCGTGAANTVCDGNGSCFGCDDASDCVDVGGCQQPTCVGGVCGSAPDPTDVVVDANECTEDLCTGPVPNHPNKPLGAVCGGARACDGSGQCLGARCPDNPCPSGSSCVDGVCCNTACDQPCEACSKDAKGGVGLDGTCEPVAKGQDPTNECPAPEVCDGTVGVTACKLPNGESCADGAACNSGLCVDAFCCDAACSAVCQSCALAGSQGTCTNMPDGTDPESECSGSVLCNGTGACGSLFGNGAACTTGVECQTGNCVDGVCCDTTCTGACRSCSAAATKGTCTNFAANTDPADAECPGGALACDGTGACKKIAAETCAAAAECISGNCVDGVCCETACAGDCRSCALAGTAGVCTSIPSGQDPQNECAGAATCNGLGACDIPLGGACSTPLNCQSGFCVDGVCCDAPCTGTCQACSSAKKGTGPSGTCGPISSGSDPDSECTNQGSASCGTDGSCDGAGACRKYAGGKFYNPATESAGGQVEAPPALGDVNGDGKLDIVASLSNASSVSVLINQGTGTFANGATYNAGGSPGASPALGDVNGDGKLDIVVPLSNSYVSVLLNSGTGTFNNQNQYNVGGTPQGPVVVRDVNGDGKLDIVVSLTSSYVSVLLNSGTGTFNNQDQYNSGGTVGGPVALGDVIGDGKLDIVAPYTNGSSISVLLNNGTGTFNNQTSYSAGGAVQAPVVLGDVSGDGRPDIVVASEVGSNVVVMLNSCQ